MKPVNLICLPFAGGNKYSYREYELKAPPSIKVIPVEYPGRGARMREPLLRNMKAIVDDLYRQVCNTVELQPYAIYGHSMGGLAAFLLTQKLLQHTHRPPIGLFISGTTGPSAPTRGSVKRHLLDKDAFISEIIDLDGMPAEILESKEMMEYFEPILRADFTATETYIHEETPQLDLPMIVITGTEEDMKMEDVQLWQKENSQTIDFRQMPGKHFFIFHHAEKIVELIADQLVNHIKLCQP
jgi:surfactin synthase thioesterase subunit